MKVYRRDVLATGVRTAEALLARQAKILRLAGLEVDRAEARGRRLHGALSRLVVIFAEFDLTPDDQRALAEARRALERVDEPQVVEDDDEIEVAAA